MRVATGAAHLGPPHAVGTVSMFLDRAFLYRLVETWPAGAGFILRFGAEERLPATGAHVHSGIFRLVVFAGKRRLGSGLAHDLKLLRREFLLPFGFGFLDFLSHKEAIS